MAERMMTTQARTGAAGNEAPFTGLTAKITLGEDVLAYASGMDLTIDKTIIEILAFGMTYKEKVPAIKDWSATIDGTVALAAGGSQAKLHAAFESGELLEISCYLDDDTFFKGKAYVSSFNINAAPDDKISLSSELAGSGAVILTVDGTEQGTTGGGGTL